VDGHFPAAGVVRFPPQKPDDLMKLSPLLALVALLALAFTLATGLASRADRWSRRDQSGNLFGMLFGDGRKLFANQFFTMADVYFHSGYYPSVFDQKSAAEKEIISASHGKKETEDDEKNEDFLGKPKDWIDAFGRHFRITQHTHLENHTEREILPWLRLAADLDPQKIETFTVGAFFLREHLNRPDQAEAFLREGLRNNPANCEILFELGRIYQREQSRPRPRPQCLGAGREKIPRPHAGADERRQAHLRGTRRQPRAFGGGSWQLRPGHQLAARRANCFAQPRRPPDAD
jgi:hypothetical protein